MTGWANCDSVSKGEEIFFERFLKLRPLVGEIHSKFFIKIYTLPSFSVNLISKEFDISGIDNFFLKLTFRLIFITIFEITIQ